jgi:hypothetical protein
MAENFIESVDDNQSACDLKQNANASISSQTLFSRLQFYLLELGINFN